MSLSCDINTGKNQSDCTNCLKCLRMSDIQTEQCRFEPTLVVLETVTAVRRHLQFILILSQFFM